MASRKKSQKSQIPDELRRLAEALRSFENQNKPTKAKLSAAEKMAVEALRGIRAEKKRAEKREQDKKEEEDLLRRAKEWASSGDPGGRRRKRRGKRRSLRRGAKRAHAARKGRKRRLSRWAAYVKAHAGALRFRGKSPRARMRALAVEYRKKYGVRKSRDMDFDTDTDYGFFE